MIDVAKEITQALKDYTTEVEKGLENASEQIAKETVTRLRSTSPKRHGKYEKGWRLKKLSKGYVVHNATRAGLAHLLEFGHATRNGRRTAAQPHIKPVEEQAISEFEKAVVKVIKG
ncbi:HK97 gp10 family phage protein [Shouchella lonarensis]|uniref:Bacteriophage HK97-gp10, putative tail-component n=1 Tax=Shouchella lonarensis TaxID=1464122 RepID=A0A1G6IIA5_9BACI|nr:HK97 gp10 family phage protein [Shouchella lonarensis]SDC06150.1 Bacteriophage HK97-gp10, putative tail-component [Shouchella lonarensis]